MPCLVGNGATYSKRCQAEETNVVQTPFHYRFQP